MSSLGVLTNIGQLARCADEGGQADVQMLAGAAVAWRDGKIEWVGAERELPEEYAGAERFDAGGRLAVPGLVDCHTHLCFGGWRGDEFEQRILGKSYLDIARAGGGIASTLAKTRAATEEELADRGAHFLAEIGRLGVTTVECKSGYGLSLEHELKQLRAYKKLAASQPLRIVPTLLAAHIVPPEHRENRERYIATIVEEIVPRAASEGLARFCDVFLEQTAFSYAEAERVLRAGISHGLRAKLHADQLSDGNGASLAAEIRAASADHLEHISDEGARKMAEAGVVAVTLPIASLYTHEAPLDARRLLRAGVQVAVATDFNPGSAPSYHLPFAMMLACTMNRLTPTEALKGATILAAKAIGVDSETGSVEPGKSADLAVIDAPDVNHWLYHFRANACVMALREGKPVF